MNQADRDWRYAVPDQCMSPPDDDEPDEEQEARERAFERRADEEVESFMEGR